jgi:chromosome partitioning protein
MKGKLEYNTIREKRIELDRTQNDISECTGVSLSTIKLLETGRSDTTLDNLKKICDELELNIDEIYDPEYRNTKVISIVNNKGGVGKTSISSSLSYILAEMGNKVLCIDGDMSMNLTNSLGVVSDDINKNIGMAIKNEDDLENYIIETQYDNIDFIVSEYIIMSEIELLIFPKNHRETIVKKIMRNIIKKGIYDYVIIDTNPTLSILNYNFIVASDYIIIPILYEKFAVDGLSSVLRHINGIKETYENIKIAGILINKFDKRNRKLNSSCDEIVKACYGDLMFETRLGIDQDIANAQMESVSITTLNKKTRLSKELKKFAKELLTKIK